MSRTTHDESQDRDCHDFGSRRFWTHSLTPGPRGRLRVGREFRLARKDTLYFGVVVHMITTRRKAADEEAANG